MILNELNKKNLNISRKKYVYSNFKYFSITLLKYVCNKYTNRLCSHIFSSPRSHLQCDKNA